LHFKKLFHSVGIIKMIYSDSSSKTASIEPILDLFLMYFGKNMLIK